VVELGFVVGLVVGAVVGAEVGLVVGLVVGAVVGAEVGLVVGLDVGAVVGAVVGFVVGVEVGRVVGAVVGLVVGAVVGAEVGLVVGVVVGAVVGAVVGFSVGFSVGAVVEEAPEEAEAVRSSSRKSRSQSSVEVLDEKRSWTAPLLTKLEKAPLPLKERELHFQSAASELSPTETHLLVEGSSNSNSQVCSFFLGPLKLTFKPNAETADASTSLASNVKIPVYAC
jgi:hypothetical protein